MDLIDLGLWRVDIFARYGGFKGLWNCDQGLIGIASVIKDIQ